MQLILLLIFTLFLSTKVEADWDFIAYTACVLQLDETEEAIIHSQAYKIAQNTFDSIDYQELRYKNDYRKNLYLHPSSFIQNLSFYKIKPLYIYTAYFLSKIGFKINYALQFLSLLPYFLFGIVLIWIIQLVPLHSISRLLLFIALISFNPLTDMARECTPDMLSCFLLTLTSIVFLRTNSQKFLFLLTFLLIITRLDNVIFCIVLVGLSLFFESKNRKIKAIHIALLLAIYLWINYYYHSYSWATLFYHTFIQLIENPHSTYITLTFSQYVAVLTSHIDNFVCPVAFILFILSIPLYIKYLLPKSPSLLLLAIFSTIIVRFFLFPTLSLRFYNAYFYIISIIYIFSYEEIKKSYLCNPKNQKNEI